MASSPLLEGTGLKNGYILSLPKGEYDGTPIRTFDSNGYPVIDVSALNFKKVKLIGFNKGSRFGKETIGTFELPALLSMERRMTGVQKRELVVKTMVNYQLIGWESKWLKKLIPGQKVFFGLKTRYFNRIDGGGRIEYTPHPNNPVHISFPLLIGGGQASIDSARRGSDHEGLDISSSILVGIMNMVMKFPFSSFSQELILQQML